MSRATRKEPITTPTTVDERRRDAFAERVFTSSIVTLEMLSIYLGDRLGFYRALSDGGTTIVVDERVAGQFTAPGDAIERMMYGLRLEPTHLPPERDERTTRGGHGHRDAPRHAPRIRSGRRLLVG
ncbi:MAG: hypothetical protein DWG74_00655 [Chloroflexi bacterium]|nr:hypothetical protein [Chloroflexota bacterium]